jgi:hypothetical protein
MVVDSTNPEVFRVKIRDTVSAEEFVALVQDETLENKHKALIQKAEWSKTPIDLTINATEVGGEIRKAIVMSAKNPDNPEQIAGK